MNETTEKLIRELADKLGTTTEHLWGVLVRQAPISSAIKLILFCVISLALVWLRKFLLRKPNIDTPEQLVFVAVAQFIVLAIFCLSAESIFAGLFNPEFWALQKLIHP